MVSTDLNPVQLLSWVLRMAPEMESLEVFAIRIPAAGTYRFCRVRGMDVLVADWERNTAVLRESLEKSFHGAGQRDLH